MKKVLVLMSTYNGSKYLKEQIQSILGQKEVECKLLIRDDGSKDGTIELLNSISSTLPEGTISLLLGDNVGVFNSFSSLVRHAVREFPDYDYYAFSDQDDIWLPNKLCSAVKTLSTYPKKKPIAYCSNSTLVDKERNRIKEFWRRNEPKLTKDRILFINYAQGCTMVFNKIALEMYAERSFNLGKLHDYMLALLCIYYGELFYDENSYLLYRQHENNVVGGRKRTYNKFQVIWNLVTFKSNRDEFCRNILNHFTDLTTQDVTRIKRVARYKDNFICKLRLLCYRPVYYKSFKENVLIGVRILLGTF